MSILQKPAFGMKPKASPRREGLALDLPMLGVGDLQDYSGNGNTATNNGATWVDGKYGPALRFDGVNDWVDTNWLPEYTSTSAFTFVVPIKTSDTSRNVLIGNGRFSGGFNSAINLETTVTSGLARVYLRTISATKDYATTIPVVDGQKHVLVFTYDGNQSLIIYVDGQEVAVTKSSDATLSGTFSSGLSFKIGRDNRLANWFGGEIDYATVYSRALSAQEIKSLYENPWQDWQQDNTLLFASQGTPTGFNAAWARNSNNLIGAL